MPAIAQGKFVVLGGASQVGSHIAEQLLAADARAVVLFDNLSLGSLEPLQPLLADARCRFVRGDVLRLNELMEPLAQADGVFSVAGIMPSTIAENPWMSLDVNVRGVQNALEACRWQRVKKIVLSSSAGVYGVMQDDAVTEDAPLRWQSAPPQLALYSATKIIGEALAQLARQQGGPEWVALRYSAVYGARQHRRAVMGGHIHESCLRVRRGEPPVIDGDGRQVQDYIHVGDVARANLMAMESDLGGEGLNIVAGQDTSQARIVELVLQAAGSTLQPEYRPYVVTRLPPVTRIGLAREKARRMLGWEPQVSIEEGVAGVAALGRRTTRAKRLTASAAAAAHSGWMFTALITGSQLAMSERMRAATCWPSSARAGSASQPPSSRQPWAPASSRWTSAPSGWRSRRPWAPTR